MTSRTFFTNLVTWEGTLSRGDFWRLYFPLAIFQVFLEIPRALSASRLVAWAYTLLAVFIAIATVFQILKRLSDTNHSRWLIFLLLVPVANLYPIYLLLLKKGFHASE